MLRPQVESPVSQTSDLTTTHALPSQAKAAIQDVGQGMPEGFAYKAHMMFTHKMLNVFFPHLSEMEFKGDGSCSAASDEVSKDHCSLFTAFYRTEREPPLNREERLRRASTAAQNMLESAKPDGYYDKLKQWHFKGAPQDRDAFPPSDTEMPFARVTLWWLRQSPDTWPAAVHNRYIIFSKLLKQEVSKHLK